MFESISKKDLLSSQVSGRRRQILGQAKGVLYSFLFNIYSAVQLPFMVAQQYSLKLKW
jgi:hypothetical protein